MGASTRSAYGVPVRSDRSWMTKLRSLMRIHYPKLGSVLSRYHLFFKCITPLAAGTSAAWRRRRLQREGRAQTAGRRYRARKSPARKKTNSAAVVHQRSILRFACPGLTRCTANNAMTVNRTGTSNHNTTSTPFTSMSVAVECVTSPSGSAREYRSYRYTPVKRPKPQPHTANPGQSVGSPYRNGRDANTHIWPVSLHG